MCFGGYAYASAFILMFLRIHFGVVSWLEKGLNLCSILFSEVVIVNLCIFVWDKFMIVINVVWTVLICKMSLFCTILE